MKSKNNIIITLSWVLHNAVNLITELIHFLMLLNHKLCKQAGLVKCANPSSKALNKAKTNKT